MISNDIDMLEKYNIDYLRQLENESIHIIREAITEFKNPVMLYSVGKDSSVMLHLARKAFCFGNIPFHLIHIDTGFKPTEIIDFRDKFVKKIGAKLIVGKNNSKEAKKLSSDDAHTDIYIYQKKTKPLLESLKVGCHVAALCGARREEEKSRAKERIFSVRNNMNSWEPKDQRPELWHTYNTKLLEGQTMRVFPLSNWTEADIWAYILEEKIEIVSLYFAKKRKVIKRNNMLLRVDEYVIPKKGEVEIKINCRYRTLGCSPSTGLVKSNATTIEEILQEVLNAKKSERENRAIDRTSDSSMENKKREGYF